MSMISSLPEEIQEKIILKLPVKSISTCKCVCKLWLNLSSSPKFIRDHIKLPPCPDMNLIGFIVMNNKSSLCYVEYDFENHEQFCQKPVKELFNLSSHGCFDATREENIIIVGSCNGLVCLATKIDGYRSLLFGHVYVCNPITQECVQLPSLVPCNEDYHDAGYRYNFYGFGYLCSSTEYKVVRISYKFDSSTNTLLGKVYVYTLGDGRGWRYTGEITEQEVWLPKAQGIYVDGALYWTDADLRHSHQIAVFDLSDEKIFWIPLPPRWAYNMVVLEGQLCIFKETTWTTLGRIAEALLWFLTKKVDDNSDGKEQDGEDKQSKWFWRQGSTVILEDVYKYQPLTITKNGEILLLYRDPNQPQEKCVAICYDPKASSSKELGDVGFPLPAGDGKATIHVNSYISLESLGEQTVSSARL